MKTVLTVLATFSLCVLSSCNVDDLKSAYINMMKEISFINNTRDEYGSNLTDFLREQVDTYNTALERYRAISNLTHTSHPTEKLKKDAKNEFPREKFSKNWQKKYGVEVEFNRVKIFHNEMPTILTALTTNQYLGKDSLGQATLISSENVSLIFPLNKWTKYSDECDCIDLGIQNCACCETGGCPCTVGIKACVKCGYQNDPVWCSDQILRVDVAANFQTKSGPLVFIGFRNIINFYSYNTNLNVLKEKKDSIGRKFIEFPEDISSVSYNELFTYDVGGFRKRRLLFVFSQLGETHFCYEIILHPLKDSFQVKKLLEWTHGGKNFQVLSHAGTISIGFNLKETLRIEEVKIANSVVSFSKFITLEDCRCNFFQYYNNGREKFLLTKNENLVHIYRFSDRTLVSHQRLYSQEKDDKIIIVNVPTYENQAMLLFLSENEINVYIHRLNKLILISKMKFEHYSLRSTVSLQLNGVPYLLMNKNNHPELFEVNFSEGNQRIKIDKLERKFENVKSLFEDQYRILSEIEERLQGSLLNIHETKRKLTIRGFASFENPVVTHSMLDYTDEDSIASFKQVFDSVTHEIQYMNNWLKRTEVSLRDVVPKEGSNKIVTGDKHFYGPKTSINELFVKHAIIGKVIDDHDSVDDTLKNLVRINDQRQIQGRKLFIGNVVVKDLRTSTLNRKDTSDYVTTEEPAIIEGAKYVNGITVQNDVLLQSNSRVDKILPENIIQQSGNYNLGSCNFKNLVANGGISIEDGIINQEIFTPFVESLFKLDGNISIPGSAMFLNLAIQKDLEASSIMDVSNDQLSELLLRSKNEKLNNVNVQSSVQCADLDVEKIGNEVFPEDFVTRTRSFLDFGSKNFNNTNFRELSVGGYVDHVKTKDLVTKSTPQEILGVKTFANGVRVLGNLNINSSLIDGIDVNLLFIKADQPKNVLVFEDPVVVPGVVVKGNVNNMTLDQIAKDLVFKDEDSSVISGRKIFLKNLKVKKDSLTTKINGKDLEKFVNTRKKNVITAKKIFCKDVVIDNLNVRGLIDNTNLSALIENSLFLNKELQAVSGPKYFETFFTHRLSIDNRLNLRPVDKLLTKSSEQTFSSVLQLRNATFTYLNAERVTLPENCLVNGISLSHLKKIRREVLLDKHLTVEGNVEIGDLRVASINNIRHDDMNDLLLQSSNFQVMSGDINCKVLKVDGFVTTSESMKGNAVLLKEKVFWSLGLTRKNFVSKDTHWEHMVVQEINSDKLVNGISIRDLAADSVYIEDETTYSIKGTKTFMNGFKVNGDLDSSNINGRNFKFNLFSKTTPQSISSRFTFDHLTTRNVLVKSFNGIDINRIKLTEKTGETIIRGPLTFDGFVHVSSLELGSTIQNLSLYSIVKDAVNLKERKILINGKMNFLFEPSFTDINVKYLNGHFEELRKRESYPNSTLQSLIVNGTVLTESLSARKISTMNQYSLLSPGYLRKNFIFTSSQLLDTLKFQSITIEGDLSADTINDLKLNEDVLTRNTPQIIPHTVTLLSMGTKDVKVDGRINGYKILREKISSKKPITKVIPGFITNETINITGDVYVKGKFGHNELNVPDGLVFLNKKNYIKGLVSFASPLVISFIDSTEQTLNGISLSVLDAYLKYYRKMFTEKFRDSEIEEPYSYHTNLKMIFERECRRTSYLQSALTNAFEEPHAFDLVEFQSFEKELIMKAPLRIELRTPILIFKFASDVWMINSLHFESCKASVLIWNMDLEKFDEYYTLENVGEIRQWILLESDNESVYILEVSSGNNCGTKGSSLWKATSISTKLQKIQDLRAAVNAIVDSTYDEKRVYLDTGYELNKYIFRNGMLIEYTLRERKIDISRSILKPDGKKFTVRVKSESLDLIDGHRLREIYMPNIKEVSLLMHLRDVIVILTKTKETKERIILHHEINLYKNFSLILMEPVNINEPRAIYPLDLKYSSNSTFVLALYKDESPKVFVLGGKPFMRLWAELPIRTGPLSWAYGFTDSRDNYYLALGDSQKIVVTKLRKMGSKYSGKILTCT